MSNVLVESRKPRIIFFGMPGNFSSPPLKALLANGCEVCAIVVPTSPIAGRSTPAIQPRGRPRASRIVIPILDSALQRSLEQSAWEHNIPLWEATQLADAEVRTVLASYQADILCIACFSHFVPRSIRDIFPLGCLNLHPSLLPANRGPVPLFWTFREGESHAGITVHFISDEMDGGDILAQEVVEISDGISYNQLETLCAEQGGDLLARSVWRLYQGNAQRREQDKSRSSYHSFPLAEEMVVPTKAWTARHVYNYICGIRSWSGPVELETTSGPLFVERGISYSTNMQGRPGEIALGEEGTFWITCQEGSVHVNGSTLSNITLPVPAAGRRAQ